MTDFLAAPRRFSRRGWERPLLLFLSVDILVPGDTAFGVLRLLVPYLLCVWCLCSSAPQCQNVLSPKMYCISPCWPSEGLFGILDNLLRSLLFQASNSGNVTSSATDHTAGNGKQKGKQKVGKDSVTLRPVWLALTCFLPPDFPPCLVGFMTGPVSTSIVVSFWIEGISDSDICNLIIWSNSVSVFQRKKNNNLDCVPVVCY